MDWNAAIEKNREALKRVLAMLVAMAGLGGEGATLPRHLHRAVLRLLRPAEAAARRLIIVAALRRQVVTPPPRHLLGQVSPSSSALHRLSLPLFDALSRRGSRHGPVTRSVPRICIPGLTERFPDPRPPSPDDPIDARRLALRFQALGRVLDDLPREARRFARWRASRDAANAQIRQGLDAAGVQIPGTLYGAGTQNKKTHRPFRRFWPLRPGRPPGWCRRPSHEVHEVLNVAHGLAIWAMERPDTS